MRKDIKIELLPEQVIKDLKAYTDSKCKCIDKAVRKHTEQALNEIIYNSPVRKKVPKSGVIMVNGIAKRNYQPGSYKRGWIRYVSTAKEGRTQGYIRNGTNYQLTHLLELGHKSRDGKKVSPIKHIIPAEIKERTLLLDDIDKILRSE